MNWKPLLRALFSRCLFVVPSALPRPRPVPSSASSYRQGREGARSPLVLSVMGVGTGRPRKGLGMTRAARSAGKRSGGLGLGPGWAPNLCGLGKRASLSELQPSFCKTRDTKQPVVFRFEAASQWPVTKSTLDGHSQQNDKGNSMQSRARDGTDVKEGEASREQCPAVVWCHSGSPTIYHSYAGAGAGCWACVSVCN